MKMNKKGFTLIEMLVVIAIIAILVAIVIPVVSNSTMKATAATNAANLRSYKAELSIDYLDNNAIDGTTGTVDAPELKACGDAPAGTASYKVDANGNITVGIGVYGIDYYADIAETGTKESAATLSAAVEAAPEGGNGGGADEGGADEGGADEGAGA